jgi:hypothetical protein
MNLLTIAKLLVTYGANVRKSVNMDSLLRTGNADVIGFLLPILEPSEDTITQLLGTACKYRTRKILSLLIEYMQKHSFLVPNIYLGLVAAEAMDVDVVNSQDGEIANSHYPASHVGSQGVAHQVVESAACDLSEDNDSVPALEDTLLHGKSVPSVSSISSLSQPALEHAVEVIAQILASSAISCFLVVAVNKLEPNDFDRRMAHLLTDLAQDIEGLATEQIQEESTYLLHSRALPIAARTREISMSGDGQFHTSPAQLSAEIPGRYLEKYSLQRGLEKCRLKIKAFHSVKQKSEMALKQASQFQKPVNMSKYVHSSRQDSVSDCDHEGAPQVEPEGTGAGQLLMAVSEFLRSVNVQSLLLQKVTTEFSRSSLWKETIPSGKEPATMESSITPAGDASLWPVMFMDGKSDITFEKTHLWSISDLVKCWVEDQLHTAIVWWPLTPPRRPLKPEFSRVVWTCVSNWFI